MHKKITKAKRALVSLGAWLKWQSLSSTLTTAKTTTKKVITQSYALV
jgi:hypothetical protein